MASAHPVKETIYNEKSGSERGMGYAVIAVLVCVLLDFMNPARRRWVGGLAGPVASFGSCV